MLILVSACLLGQNCKYNGGNNAHEALIRALARHTVIPVCPETAGGLPVPRPPVECRSGAFVTAAGQDVTTAFERGCNQVLADIQDMSIDLAILQPRSPSCGVFEIYDGSFTGRLIPGEGLLARMLREAGIPVTDSEQDWAALLDNPLRAGETDDASPSAKF